MTADQLPAPHAVWESYVDRLHRPNTSLPTGLDRGPDEMAMSAGGEAAFLADAVTRFGTIGLQSRRRLVERLVADDGITYGGLSPERPPRPWLLDPLPLVVDAAGWARLEAGLQQRARLLDAVLADLCGPRRLVAEGVVPAAVVAAHPGFLVPAHGVPSPGGAALPLTATDLVRGPSGQWCVVADRTQAPSGAGYAMANRRVIARALEPVHRLTSLRRLRGWFDIMQATLQDAAPAGVDDVPRVVLLTPGPGSETSYDQGLLSILLGHPLAQSDDLVIRDGRLWLRTTGRLEAVDVVLRRVDAAWSDSLDLLSASRLGVPGLVAAARRGTVSVVNPLRAGVLENPGLFPHLAGAARLLLGEDLRLDQPATWWCGDERSLQHVLAELPRLLVKPLARGVGDAQTPGWLLTERQLGELRARLRAEPWAWTAQEPLVPSTAPVVTSAGLEPRNVTLRAFTAALDGVHHVMPGGLARVASGADSYVVTNQSGAGAKDVWVLDADDVPVPRVVLDTRVRLRVLPSDAPLPGLTPRAADNLYWMGRYAERAEFVARLLMVADNMVEDHARRPDTPGNGAMRDLLRAVTQVTGVLPGFAGADAETHLRDPQPQLIRLVVDDSVPGTLASSVRRAAVAASDVRELLSQDTTAVVSRLQRTITEAQAEEPDVPVQHVAARALESSLALAGLTAESLIRDPTWGFLEAGRRIERAQTTLRLLRGTIASVTSPVAEAMTVESVLRIGDSLITYRRRMAAGVGSARPVEAALDLLVRDEHNPRSVAFQVERLAEALAHAPAPALTAAVLDLRTRVRAVDPGAMTLGPRHDLAGALAALEDAARDLSDAIVATHFRTQAPQSSFAVAELAGGPR